MDYDFSTLIAAGITLLVFIGIFLLIAYILSALGYMKMFKKAGLSGWRAFIPILNTYTIHKISWTPASYWIYAAASVFFGLSRLYEDILVLMLIGAAAGILSIVYTVKRNLKLARAFGQGTAIGILLLFFPFVTSLVLGFGSAQYVGIPTKEAPAAETTEE